MNEDEERQHAMRERCRIVEAEINERFRFLCEVADEPGFMAAFVRLIDIVVLDQMRRDLLGISPPTQAETLRRIGISETSLNNRKRRLMEALT